MLRGRRSAFALALLLAITGAAAQDPTTSPTPTTSTPTPSTTTSTPSPATTTPAPAPTTATPTSTPTSASTPSTSTKLPVAAAGAPINNSVLTVQFADACADSTLFLREDDLGVVCENCTDYTSSAKLPALQITTGLTTKRVQLSTLERSSLNSLVIQSTSGTVPQLGVTSRSFVNLAAMTALSFTRVDFTDTRASLTVPASLAYLKLSSTNAVDLSLTIKNNNPSELKQVDFVRNQFTSLPLIFYERKYTSALEINKDFSFTGETTELSAEEYANAKANVGSALSSLVAFQESCNGSSVAPTTAAHVVCLNSALSGIRSIKDSGAHSTGSSQGDAAGGATPTPSVTRAGSSTDTTLTIIVIVVAVIAAILAYFVARRYFCTASSSSASPSHNERAVGLISKEDTQTANGKLSFISGDDTLRQIRLEQQDVSLGKSLGTGFLWTGDFQGRKVVIKRVEAESNDSRVTKALINQARSLVPVAHPNIAKLVGVTWIQGTDFGIVAEFMEKGTLKSVLMDLDTELDLQSKLHMCLDIAQALVYLHNPERNMYMKSLSSRKVLVNGAIECKLNLFECHATTTKIEVPDVFGAGEMAWWAPELVLHKTALDPRKVNIFALGVLICEIITRATPYQSVVDDKGHTLADLELTQRIRRQERLQPHENRHEFTELPSALRDVVERCLSYQPHLRPTAEEVVQCLEAVKDYSERMGSTTSL